jgi:hypothetical protein
MIQRSDQTGFPDLPQQTKFTPTKTVYSVLATVRENIPVPGHVAADSNFVPEMSWSAHKIMTAPKKVRNYSTHRAPNLPPGARTPRRSLSYYPSQIVPSCICTDDTTSEMKDLNPFHCECSKHLLALHFAVLKLDTLFKNLLKFFIRSSVCGLLG